MVEYEELILLERRRGVGATVVVAKLELIDTRPEGLDDRPIVDSVLRRA